jgi:hypothetical protein
MHPVEDGGIRGFAVADSGGRENGRRRVIHWIYRDQGLSDLSRPRRGTNLPRFRCFSKNFFKGRGCSKLALVAPDRVVDKRKLIGGANSVNPGVLPEPLRSENRMRLLKYVRSNYLR